jgi:hypothetical protein
MMRWVLLHALAPGQIKAHLAGMEMTDGVHWAEQVHA